MPVDIYGVGKICGMVLSLFVEAVDQDYDKQWNYLLMATQVPRVECPNTEDVKDPPFKPVGGEVYFSGRSVSEPFFKEGEWIRAKIHADCKLGGGVDERETEFWAAYQVWTCDVTSLEPW